MGFVIIVSHGSFSFHFQQACPETDSITAFTSHIDVGTIATAYIAGTQSQEISHAICSELGEIHQTWQVECAATVLFSVSHGINAETRSFRTGRIAAYIDGRTFFRISLVSQFLTNGRTRIGIRFWRKCSTPRIHGNRSRLLVINGFLQFISFLVSFQ